jgi:hypothetical protein
VNQLRWHWLFRCVFVAFIIYSSAMTALQMRGALGSSVVGLETFVFWLAAFEIVAALALLWRRAQAAAGVVLCGIFAVAAFLDISNGGIPARFLFYAASVAVVVFLDGAAPAGASAARRSMTSVL